MEKDAIVQQTRVENEALEFVTMALERTIAWPVQGGEFTRKLSSLRFMTESFQRHMERLFALEELDGYMDVVCRLHPEMSGDVDELKNQQEKLRNTIRQLILKLERTPPGDLVVFNAICEELQSLIKWLRQYNQIEKQLLVAAGLHQTDQ